MKIGEFPIIGLGMNLAGKLADGIEHHLLSKRVRSDDWDIAVLSTCGICTKDPALPPRLTLQLAGAATIHGNDDLRFFTLEILELTLVQE